MNTYTASLPLKGAYYDDGLHNFLFSVDLGQYYRYYLGDTEVHPHAAQNLCGAAGNLDADTASLQRLDF
jgi:hypothetical protein